MSQIRYDWPLVLQAKQSLNFDGSLTLEVSHRKVDSLAAMQDKR